MKVIALLVPAVLALSATPAPAQRPGPGFNPAHAIQHFLLKGTGGVIAVEAGNPEDPMAPDEIRAHLSQIAKSGVPELQLFRTQINYTYTPTAEGGQLLIETTNTEAMIAIHAYLRSEIREFRTGDSEEIK